MKKTMFLLTAIAASAVLYSGCAKPEISNGNQAGNLVTVYFGTENVDPSTKATLTPNEGETAFEADWENGDVLSVEYISPTTATNKIIQATWDAENKKFSAELPNETGAWDFSACYPVPNASNNSVDFGPDRTQKGNAYNSKYDIMIGAKSTTNSAPGKDDDGSDIVFPMTRQTAIAYFHFTSDLDEAITKATLTVSGDGAAIASNYAYVSDFAWAAAKDCQSITLTFPEDAPNAQDFKLWFNVLPTIYESMSLTIETATKTLSISKNSIGEYVAGKLYKVNKAVSWTDKGSEPGKTYAYKKISSQSELTDGSYLIVNDDYSFAVAGSKTATNMIKGGAGTAVDIVGDVIAYSADLALDAFEINSVEGGFSIKGSKCGYIGYTLTSNNGLQGDPSTVYVNTISVSAGVATVTTKNSASTTYTLCCNPNSGTPLVKYYKTVTDTYKGLSLYKYQLVDGSSLPTTYTISMDSVIGGNISASVTSAEEGTEITLTATPDEGFAFNNDWSVKDADNTEVPVSDGKFKMPAKDVTVSGSFSKVDYTITKASCEGGSFTVKKDGVEVTKAQIGDAITLEASAAEGYEFDSWTVTNESTSKTVYVSENTFTMPGANVTVEANFVELAVVPVYSSLEELVKAGKPSTDTYVTVTLTNDEITGIYTSSKGYRNGIYFMVGTQEIEIYCQDVPEAWIIGGYVSGTLTNCLWTLYNGTWELCPTDWTELTYAAPCETPVITLNGAEASITCATEGATIHYTLDDTDPTESSDVYSAPITLTDGQTIKAKAFLAGHKSSEIASKTYSAGSTGEQTLKVDFESELTTYSDWEFNNLSTESSTGAHGGNYHATNGEKTRAYAKTKNKIASPKSIKCYYTKLSGNTNKTSYFVVQVSTDGTSWTVVSKGKTMNNVTQNQWEELSADLSSYSDVYVRVYYTGTNAKRALDDVELIYE